MGVAENREKWATALESGRYPQTTQELKDSDGWCCLSVAQEEFEPQAFKLVHPARYRIGMGAFCSFNVCVALGLTEADCQMFVDLNDNVGYDFVQIAAEVRALPPVGPATKIRKGI